VRFERTEAPGERDLLRRCQALIAKHDYFVVEERLRDLGERVVVQRGGQIDP
jgi:hypothetical protein